MTSGIFPDNSSIAVFIAYMATFVLQGILTRSSQTDGKYSFNTTTGVLAAEGLKLGTAMTLYTRAYGVGSFGKEFLANKNLLKLYFVPAFLYCIYNNLTYINLANYDPTSYFLLLQFRVVVTGVVFLWIFEKKLSKRQWGSLIILTLGCILKEYGTRIRDNNDNAVQTHSGNFYIHTGLILVQVFCSCFAGVYNEKLLKQEGQQVPLMMQNTFMYLDSMIANIIFLIFKGEFFEALSFTNLSALMSGIVIAVIVNNAAIGLITSLFLKKLNSVVKVYASSIELMLTAYLSWIIFGIPVDIYTFISLMLVIVAVYMYVIDPIKPTLPK